MSPKTILNLGLIGRNVNPTYTEAVQVAPNTYLAGLPAAQIAAQGPSGGGVGTVGCNDPSPGAIIRLARLRDNPSTGTRQAMRNSRARNPGYLPGHRFLAECAVRLA